MNFNTKITHEIISDLQNAKKNNLSFRILKQNILENVGAIDSTFPIQIKDMLEVVLSKIENHQQIQYSNTLNTPNEGTYDETTPVGDLFDTEIAYLTEYCMLAD